MARRAAGGPPRPSRTLTPGQPRREARLPDLNVWTQTSGTALLTAKRCSLARVPMPAQDSHSAYGLLYLAAVRDNWREQEHRQGRVDSGPAHSRLRRQLPDHFAACADRSPRGLLVHIWSADPQTRLPLSAVVSSSRGSLLDDVTVLSQLLVLAGVVVGALASYLTTAVTERTRWKRTLDSRWDDRRVDVYASYAQAVKDIITISSRIYAGRNITADSDSWALPPSKENLELLESAKRKRATAWEPVLLLGHPDTVKAARNWHESVWVLERWARGDATGKREDWEKASSEVTRARSLFYESARNDLQVRGGAQLGTVDIEARQKRIEGNSDS